jgi:hypothetical protein
MDIDDPEKSYIAGFVDGEGSVRIRKKRDYPTHNYVDDFEVSISNTNINVLEFIKTRYGGQIRKRDNKRPNEKLVYSLQLYSAKACKLLFDIYPFSIVKREHIKLLLAAYEVGPGELRNQYINRLLILNRRGKTNLDKQLPL